MQIPNDEYFSHVMQFLADRHTVKIPLKGYSMRPFLEDQRDYALLEPPKEPVLNEPVLVQLPTGKWVLHRIIKIEGENLTLLGDGNIMPEHCRKSDIRASVKGFYRKGSSKLDSVKGSKWKAYSFFWTRLLPIRRYLLFVYSSFASRLAKLD